MLRIGHGYDVHKIIPKDKPLILGGVDVKAEFSLEAHSDGDVILHALCDSLLGALGLGDIGRHFPDADSQYKDKPSSYFVKQVLALMMAKNYQINNVDITVVAEAPKIAPYVLAMCEKIAQLLQLDIDQVNIKATTTEKLGFTGRKEGIACYAVALISKQI